MILAGVIVVMLSLVAAVEIACVITERGDADHAD